MADNFFNSSHIASPFNSCLLLPVHAQWKQEYLTPAVYYSSVVLSIVNGIFLPVTIISNGLVMACILANRHIRRDPFMIILLSLSTTDFLVGLLTQPLDLICRISELLSRLDVNCPARLLQSVVSVACLGTSIFHICFISIERYVAVWFPYSYKRLFTNRRVTIIALLIWLFVTTYAVLPYTGYPEVGSLIGRSVIIGTNLVVTGVCYIGTFIGIGAAHNCSSTIQACPKINTAVPSQYSISTVKLEILSCRESNNLPGDGEHHLSSTEAENSYQLRKAGKFEGRSLTRKIKEMKLAKTMLFLVAILFFCYFPLMIAYIFLPKSMEAQPTNWIILSWFHFLLYFNSVINPFCYCWKMPTLRKAVYKLVCKT